MPFDGPTTPERGERPQYDRDAVALAAQNRLGRPLSWAEYAKIWDALTDAMGRSDFAS
ncbi:hypothetical protein [Falsiphaeobacter marinintestinus]|uniref:hypothetical protein n=1 Tax=Falsiphaeobacter marinintestinus TaxID=1492905 RepID=UPI0016469C30|nr:hypothetical protein [Phaeobacter marinintestinus]